MATMNILVGLKERMKIHWVAGNHDFHLLKLKNRMPHYEYPFEFVESLELVDGEHTYRFMHGYEFEYGNELKYIRPILEMLCHVMSDDRGEPADELWVNITKMMGDLHYSAFSHQIVGQDMVITHKSLHDGPAERLKDKLQKVEQRAYKELSGKPGEMLIFGHTHHAFINKEENLVNTGSWVRNGRAYNTYVELEDGKARLFVYGGEEITERPDITEVTKTVITSAPR
jgi:predicted phosphodiesterase